MTNDAKMPELLPCPFCGGPAEWQIGEYGDGHPMRYIACRDCEAMAPAVGRQEWAENAAIAAWNRRTDRCASGRQVRALMEALRELTKQGRKTWNLGAQTGSHWVHLGAAVSKAERLLAALTPAPQPEVVPMDRALVEENARLHAAMLVFGVYLLEKGETFRTGEGAELVDAYSAALTPAPDAPQPAGEAVPVAWRARRSESEEWQHFTRRPSWWEVQALYAHPPQPSETVAEVALVEARKDMQRIKERLAIGYGSRNETMGLIEKHQRKIDAALRALKGGA